MNDLGKSGVDYFEYSRGRIHEDEALRQMAWAASRLSQLALVVQAADHPAERLESWYDLIDGLADVELWATMLNYNAPFAAARRERVKREKIMSLVEWLGKSDAKGGKS